MRLNRNRSCFTKSDTVVEVPASSGGSLREDPWCLGSRPSWT